MLNLTQDVPLNTREVAVIACVPEAWIYRDIERGELVATRGCAGWLVMARDVYSWLYTGGRVPVVEPEYIQILKGDPCAYCGSQMQEIDHIMPRANGGQHVWPNLTAACALCNRIKGSRSLLAFLDGRLP